MSENETSTEVVESEFCVPETDGETVEQDRDMMAADRAAIESKHQRKIAELRNVHQAAMANQREWANITQTPQVSALVAGYAHRIVQIQEELESCKPADVSKLQGEIAALRRVVRDIENAASMDPVNRAQEQVDVATEQMRRELNQWDSENPLFAPAKEKRGRRS